LLEDAGVVSHQSDYVAVCRKVKRGLVTKLTTGYLATRCEQKNS